MGIPLVVQCHSIVSQLAHWRQIGRLQIRPTPRIWPKPRLLIGRELKMLASHWSRGPSESFQRGYPYDPEPAPIERFWPKQSNIIWHGVVLVVIGRTTPSRIRHGLVHPNTTKTIACWNVWSIFELLTDWHSIDTEWKSIRIRVTPFIFS